MSNYLLMLIVVHLHEVRECIAQRGISARSGTISYTLISVRTWGERKDANVE